MNESYRHATDRIETLVIAECPNGCDVSIVLGGEGKEEQVEELVSFITDTVETCNACGAKLGVIRQTQPTEVLK